MSVGRAKRFATLMDQVRHEEVKIALASHNAKLTELGRVVTEVISTRNAQMAEIGKVARKAFNHTFVFQQRVQEVMKPWAVLISQVADAIKPWVELQQQIQQTVPKFGPIIAQRLKEFEEFHGALIVRHKHEKLALPPFFSEMTISEIGDLFRDKEKPAIQIYDEFFSKKENTDALLMAWSKNEFFQERIPIFEQALEAHREGKHALTIPTLLPQIESILEELLGVKSFGSIKAELLKIIPRKNRKQSSYMPGVELTIEIIREQVYLDTKEDIKQEYPNRHRTLHGKNIFYYKEKYASLRCILLLDLLRFEEFDIKGYQKRNAASIH